MAIRDYFPRISYSPSTELEVVTGAEEAKKAQVTPEGQKVLAKAFRISAIATGYGGLPDSLTQRANFESAPYDFDRIIQAVDTDSYAKQAFAKYRELFWKEGWQISGENQDAVDYLYQRIDYMEIAMGRPFNEFLSDVADQYFKFHNVFIAKSRHQAIDEQFPDNLDSQSLDARNSSPIIGYYIVPTEQVEILRDKNNRPKWYKQNTSLDSSLVGMALNSGRKSDPTWKANEMIHIYKDKKPGRAFGTPFMTSSMDDIVAMRQLEEDYQNLVHRELFPLYKYTVGTESQPAQPGEVEKAAQELELLRTEGGIVVPFRHDVELIGITGTLVDPEPFLTHMKERVAVGLGVFPHHLGMVSGSGGNRDMTDRLDVALYDKIKEYQRHFAECIRLFVFDELLREGGFDPSINPKVSGVSDRCFMVFNEIDVDTQIKKESHDIQKYTANLTTNPEARMSMGMTPHMNEEETQLAMQTRMMPNQVVQDKSATGGQKSKAVDTTPAAAQKPSTGGTPNMRNKSKGASNIVRPRNQFGARTSPGIRRSDDSDLVLEGLDEIIDAIGEDYTGEDNVF